MNFKQVEAFRAVMMTRSMTTAAGLLHTSQPNVSRWIALLEKALGFVLFQRVGTRIIPTPEAEAFYADVERAFIGLESLNDSASSIRRRGTGLLRVGAVGSITQCVLPDAIALFRHNFSDIPVVVNTGGSDVVAKWLATGVCDIGFCSLHTDLPGVRYERINTAHGVGIVPRTHRLAAKRRLAPTDFRDENFISLPPAVSTAPPSIATFPTMRAFCRSKPPMRPPSAAWSPRGWASPSSTPWCRAPWTFPRCAKFRSRKRWSFTAMPSRPTISQSIR